MAEAQTNDAPRRFRSAVDPWLGGLVVLCTVVLLAAILATLGAALTWASVLALVLAAVGLALPLWVLLATHYTVGAGILTIRSGPFRWRIPLDEIEAVRPTRSPLASPALSLDRLELRRKRDPAILVSPKDRRAFLAALGHAPEPPPRPGKAPSSERR